MRITPIWISNSGVHSPYPAIEDGSSFEFTLISYVGDIWFAVNDDGLVIPINGQRVYDVTTAHPVGVIAF